MPPKHSGVVKEKASEKNGTRMQKKIIQFMKTRIISPYNMKIYSTSLNHGSHFEKEAKLAACANSKRNASWFRNQFPNSMIFAEVKRIEPMEFELRKGRHWTLEMKVRIFPSWMDLSIVYPPDCKVIQEANFPQTQSLVTHVQGMIYHVSLYAVVAPNSIVHLQYKYEISYTFMHCQVSRT